jgi:hypothetical protein
MGVVQPTHFPKFTKGVANEKNWKNDDGPFDYHAWLGVNGYEA